MHYWKNSVQRFWFWRTFMMNNIHLRGHRFWKILTFLNFDIKSFSYQVISILRNFPFEKFSPDETPDETYWVFLYCFILSKKSSFFIFLMTFKNSSFVLSNGWVNSSSTCMSFKVTQKVKVFIEEGKVVFIIHILILIN